MTADLQPAAAGPAPRYARPQRLVVKVGSSALRDRDGGLDEAFVADLVDQLAALCEEGLQVVLVSSGAVAAGLRPLGLDRRPHDLPTLQAVAAVGQGLLVHAYSREFARHGVAVGQVLLTPDDVVDRQRYLNARRTFDQLLRMGTVPVVNENDTVATHELRFGDNDRLAALVASMLRADLLALLSDVEGVHDGAPDAGTPVLERVVDFAALDDRHRGGVGSAVGSGGMATKLEAARIATYSAAHCVIARARRPGVIADLADGAAVGTWFPPSARRPESRRLWLAFAHQPTGAVLVDAGAVRALARNGSSLLAIGVTDAIGEFAAGDAIDVIGPDGNRVARGITSFAAADVRQMRGRSTDELVTAMGKRYAAAVVHRDRMVVTA